MNRKIKLVWEFYGADAADTAKHHALHLKEFSKQNDLTLYDCGSKEYSQLAEAYMVVDESNMIELRDRLKPKRGEWVD